MTASTVLARLDRLATDLRHTATEAARDADDCAREGDDDAAEYHKCRRVVLLEVSAQLRDELADMRGEV